MTIGNRLGPIDADPTALDRLRAADARAQRPSAGTTEGAAKATSAGKAEARQAGAMMEGLFMRELMKVLRESVPEGSLFGDDSGSQIFQEMLDGSLADRAAESGSIGLAEQLTESFGGTASVLARSAAPARAAITPQTAALRLQQVSESVREPGDGLRFEPPNRPEPVVFRSALAQQRSPRFGDPLPQIGDAGRIEAPAGAPVVASGRGQVVSVGKDELVVDHGGGLQSRYSRLGAVLAQPGDLVLEGQQIGEVGTAGAFQFGLQCGDRHVEVDEINGVFRSQRNPQDR